MLFLTCNLHCLQHSILGCLRYLESLAVGVCLFVVYKYVIEMWSLADTYECYPVMCRSAMYFKISFCLHGCCLHVKYIIYKHLNT